MFGELIVYLELFWGILQWKFLFCCSYISPQYVRSTSFGSFFVLYHIYAYYTDEICSYIANLATHCYYQKGHKKDKKEILNAAKNISYLGQEKNRHAGNSGRGSAVDDVVFAILHT